MKRKRPGEHVKNSRPAPLTPAELAVADDVVVTRHLLQLCLERLEAGRTLERERRIVYPEITCIVRDVERLQRRLRELQGLPDQQTAAGTPQPDDHHKGKVTTAPPAAVSFWQQGRG